MGPWNLWADRESISTPHSAVSMGTAPMACTASVCIRMPRARAISAISLMGISVPISLLAAMMVIRMVLSRIASSTCRADT